MGIPQCAAAHEINYQLPSTADGRLTQKLVLFDHLPDSSFIDIKVVCALCDRSPSSIQRDVKAGRLGAPVKIGPNAVRWRVGDVRRFLKGGAA